MTLPAPAHLGGKSMYDRRNVCREVEVIALIAPNASSFIPGDSQVPPRTGVLLPRLRARC